jgi:hypothetical protein
VAGCAELYHPRHSCVVKTSEHRRRHSEAELQAVLEKVLKLEEEVRERLA